MTLLWVFIGGGLGSITRYSFGLIFSRTNLQLPVSTLMANIVSCMVFAAAIAIFKEKIHTSSFLKPLLLMGFCGGLSTFSAFSFETFELLKQHQYVWALVNVGVSTIICLAIFYTFNKV